MLASKVCIVTGGASGIGEAIVRRFAREGAAVAILDRDLTSAEHVAQTLSHCRVTALRCDVSVESDVVSAVAAILQREGRIDVLVNNAGTPPVVAPLDELTEADWDATMNVHAKGCFLCSKHVLPHMRKQRRGSIVQVSSLAGLRGRPMRHSYIAAKHAIVGLTKSMALEGIADNIRVNAVAPGPVDTRPDADRPTPDALAQLFEAHCAAGGSEINFAILPEAIASAVLFLASDEAAHITGIVLPVDGGVMAGSAQRGRFQFPGST